MGRYRTEKVFTLGEWHLGKKPGSEYWHRCRYDPKTRQTSRISLGVRLDQEEIAKKKLTEWWIANTIKPERDGGEVLLGEVLLAYYHQHAKNLPSGRRIKASMRHVIEFFDGMTVKQACHTAQIEEFVKAMRGKGFAPTYINNLLGIIKAAVTRAHRRGELSAAPFVELIEAQSKKPKGIPLKPEQIAALFNVANKQTKLAIMIMIGTGCRPSTAYELMGECLDFENNLIDLNLPGRVQTPKYRPVVPMPPSLKAYLLPFKDAKGVLIKRANRPIKRWETAWRNARKAAGLSKDVNPYSARHSVARWLRASGVVKWNIEGMLGHRALSTTDIYAPHSPDYLADACAAIERLMQEVHAASIKLAA